MDWASLPDPTHLPPGDWGNSLDDGEFHPIKQPAAGDIDSPPAFIYHPLNSRKREIRIIYLRGSPCGNDVPTGIVKHESLNDKPHYVALSYVWGDATEKLPIFLNGHVFQVGLNLYSALEHFQKRVGTHDFFFGIWIDAICINQTDDVEKSSQVQMMGDIYSSSQFTISWLGPEADGSALAIKALDYIGEQCLSHPDGPALAERHELFTRILPSDQPPLAHRFPVDAVVSLLSRPYWRRIWIVQEVILPPTVFIICGELIIPFGLLALAVAALMELPILNSTVGGSLTTRIQPLLPILNCNPRLIEATLLLRAGDKKHPLADRLLNITQMGATNSLDHVFGLLGLASDIQKLGIRADYSLSPDDLFTSVTAALLKQGNRQFLSRSCNHGVGLPSWAVDFSKDRSDQPLSIWNPKYKLFRAGGSALFHSVSTEARTLRLSGMAVDTVNNLGPPPLRKEDPIGAYLGMLGEFARSNCHGYKTSETLIDAIHRLPFVDIEVGLFKQTQRYNKRAGQQIHEYFQKLCEQDQPLDIALRRVSVQATGIMSNIGRQLFSTSKGKLGLGPCNVQRGDLVCVFYGCEVPFIIRPMSGTPSTTGKWLWKKQVISGFLVGEAYVHGIMDGEGLDEGTRADFAIH